MKKLILLFLLITTAVLTSCEDEKKSEPDDSVYALVNIPFAKFFATEATEGFDAYSSATQKAGNGNMSYGTYHTQSVVTEAVTSGITFPVNISRELLVSLGGNEVTDDSPSLDITTSARQTTSTIRYSKEQLLFQNKDYSYYILKDAPSYYKEASGSTGNVFFGKTKGEEKDIGKLYVAIAPGEAHHNFSPAITLLKPVDENTAEEETLSVKKFTFEGGSEAYTVTAGENGSETLEPKTLSSLKTIVATDTEGKSYGLTTLQNMFWGKSQIKVSAANQT